MLSNWDSSNPSISNPYDATANTVDILCYRFFQSVKSIEIFFYPYHLSFERVQTRFGTYLLYFIGADVDTRGEGAARGNTR